MRARMSCVVCMRLILAAEPSCKLAMLLHACHGQYLRCTPQPFPALGL